MPRHDFRYTGGEYLWLMNRRYRRHCLLHRRAQTLAPAPVWGHEFGQALREDAPGALWRAVEKATHAQVEDDDGAGHGEVGDRAGIPTMDAAGAATTHRAACRRLLRRPGDVHRIANDVDVVQVEMFELRENFSE